MKNSRFGHLEGRNQGRQRHHLDPERRAEGVSLRIHQPIRGQARHQSRRADRRGPRRLLHDGAIAHSREAKLTAEHMETRADVTLEKVAEGFAITAVHLTLGKDAGRRPGEIRGARQQGQGRMPGFQAPERQDHAGRDTELVD